MLVGPEKHGRGCHRVVGCKHEEALFGFGVGTTNVPGSGLLACSCNVEISESPRGFRVAEELHLPRYLRRRDRPPQAWTHKIRVTNKQVRGPLWPTKPTRVR